LQQVSQESGKFKWISITAVIEFSQGDDDDCKAGMARWTGTALRPLYA
jgi:hypothetical protein